MEFAIGKIKDQKKVFFFTRTEDSILVIESKKVTKSLSTGLASAASAASGLVGGALEMGLGSVMDSVPGGDLVGGLVGGKIEEKAIAKMTDLVTKATESMTSEEMLKLVESETAQVTIPVDKIAKMDAKLKGMVSKKYHVSVKQKGFFIFAAKHNFEFRPDQEDNAAKVFGI